MKIGSLWRINRGYNATLYDTSNGYTGPVTIPSESLFVVTGHVQNDRIPVIAAGHVGWLHKNWIAKRVPGVTRITGEENEENV